MSKKFSEEENKISSKKDTQKKNSTKFNKIIEDSKDRWIELIKKRIEKEKRIEAKKLANKIFCSLNSLPKNKKIIPKPPKPPKILDKNNSKTKIISNNSNLISYSPSENIEEILDFNIVKNSLAKTEITTRQLKELRTWLSLWNNKIYIWIDIAKTMQYLSILVVDKYWLEIWTYYFGYFYNDLKWFKFLENIIDFIISKNNTNIILWVEATWIYHSPLINYLEKTIENKQTWNKDNKLTVVTINAIEISSRRKWNQWSKNDKLDAWIIAHYLKEVYWEFFLLEEKRKSLEEESKHSSKTWTSIKELKEVWQHISELIKMDNKKSILKKKAELLNNFPKFFSEPKRMDYLKYSHKRKHIYLEEPEFYTEEEKIQISIFDKQNKKEEVIEEKLNKIKDSNKIASVSNNRFYPLKLLYRNLAKIKKTLALTNKEIHRKNTLFFWFPTWSLLSREFTKIEIFVLSFFNADELQNISFERFRDMCIENLWFLYKWDRYKETLRTAYDRLKNNIWISRENYQIPTKNLLRSDYIQRDFLITRVKTLEKWIQDELKMLNVFIPKMPWITDLNFWLFYAELWDMIKTHNIKDIMSYIWHIPKMAAESWDFSDRAIGNWDWRTMWIQKWWKKYLIWEVYNMVFQVCNQRKSTFFYSMFRELKSWPWDWTWNHYFGKMWSKLIRVMIWLMKNQEDYNEEKAMESREKWIILAQFLSEQNKNREPHSKELTPDNSNPFNKNQNTKNRNKYKKFESYYEEIKTQKIKENFSKQVQNVLRQ